MPHKIYGKLTTLLLVTISILLASMISVLAQEPEMDSFMNSLYVHSDYNSSADPTDPNQSFDHIIIHTDFLEVISYQGDRAVFDPAFSVTSYSGLYLDEESSTLQAEGLDEPIGVNDHELTYKGVRFVKVKDFNYSNHIAYRDQLGDLYGHLKSPQEVGDTGFFAEYLFTTDQQLITLLFYHGSDLLDEKKAQGVDVIEDLQDFLANRVFQWPAYYLGPELDTETGVINALGFEDKLVLTEDGDLLFEDQIFSLGTIESSD